MENQMSVSKLKLVTKTTLCAAALASLALSPACKKEGGEGGGSSSKETATALGYMPQSASMVFGVNVASAANAGVLSKYRDEMMSQAPDEFKELEAACGINVMKDVKSVVVGIIEKEKGVIVVNGNFNKAKIEDCLTKAAEKEGEKITMADDGKLRTYKGDDPDDVMYAYWPSDGTVVFTSNELGGKEVLTAVIDGKKLGDGEVMSLIKSTKTSATFWAAGNPSKLAAGSPLDGQDISGIAMTVNAGDNLDVKVLVNFPSDAKAKEMEAMAKTGIEMGKTQPMAAPFKSIIDKFKIEADGKAVKAGISLNAGDIEKLASAAKMFGGMR